MRVVIVALLLAGCAEGPLERGASAFAEGDLDGAIAPWQEIAETGNGSGALHYNLGNAWYRKGDLPRAIAHYRLAQRLRPRDGNVHHNLAVARADLVDRSKVAGVSKSEGGARLPMPEPSRLPMPWMSFVTVGELGLLGLLLTGIGSGLALRWRRRPGPGFALPAAVAWILGVTLAVTSAAGAYAIRWHPTAVVSHESSLRDLPRVDAEERFALPSGAELTVVRELGDFVLVEDGRGRRGWISRAALLLADREATSRT